MRPRVLLTRAEGRAEGLAAALGPGVEVVELPLLRFEPLHPPLPPRREGDRLVLTSVTALEALAARGSDWLDAPTAAVGPATAAALEALGRRAAWVPAQATALQLAQAMGSLKGVRVLHPRALEVPPELERALVSAGAEVVSAALYRTVCPAGAAEALARLLPVDVVTLTSGSAARHLVGLGQDLGGAAVVVIGPSTARVCAELGLPVAAVASPHTAEGLAAAVRAVLDGAGPNGAGPNGAGPNGVVSR